MNDETTLPNAEQVEAGGQQPADLLEQVEGQETKPEETKQEDPPKKEKTPEEREISRLRRRVDNLTKRLYQGQERQPLQSEPVERNNQQDASDSDNLTLSRAELQKLIDQEAQKRAPTIRQQEDEIEHRRTVVSGLAKDWGQEKFDALASDLDDAFDGLADRSGKPKPATDAIFEAADPKALIEYLADPENADEAETLGRMSPVKAGRAVALLEAKLNAKKAEAKPQASKAAAPIEPVRASGMNNSMPDPKDTKAWIRWANAQERKGR